MVRTTSSVFGIGWTLNGLLSCVIALLCHFGDFEPGMVFADLLLGFFAGVLHVARVEDQEGSRALRSVGSSVLEADGESFQEFALLIHGNFLFPLDCGFFFISFAGRV